MASLILVGHVSDLVGRRSVLLPALVIELVAGLSFMIWHDLAGLLVARFVTGVGVGMITAAATAYLSELHAQSRPGASLQRFELVSTAANLGGLSLGPLIAGLFAQWVAGPLVVPYLAFVVLLGLAVVGGSLSPETVIGRRHELTLRPQRLSIGSAHRRVILGALAGSFASFSIFGLYSSMAPEFLHSLLHRSSVALAGFTVFAIFAAAATGQLLTRSRPPRQLLWIGILAELLGLGLINLAVSESSLAAFLASGLVSGAGAGMLFKASISTVVETAAPETRGAALATLFLAGYLGLVLPVVGLGLITLQLSLAASLVIFSVALATLLLLIAADAIARPRRGASLVAAR